MNTQLPLIIMWNVSLPQINFIFHIVMHLTKKQKYISDIAKINLDFNPSKNFWYRFQKKCPMLRCYLVESICQPLFETAGTNFMKNNIFQWRIHRPKGHYKNLSKSNGQFGFMLMIPSLLICKTFSNYFN